MIAIATLLGVVAGVFVALALLRPSETGRDLRHPQLVCGFLRAEGFSAAAGALEVRLEERSGEKGAR
jgi:hypothetical protein